MVAEVAEGYPRLLAWLTEGQASGYWNLFGAWVAVLRLIPGLRWAVWRSVFQPVARYTGWRPALSEAMLQASRLKFNHSLTVADRTHPDMESDGSGIRGLSAGTDVAVITPTKARSEMRDKVVNMSTGCIGISGLRGAGKTTLVRDFCAHRYGTPRIPSPVGIAPAGYLPGLRIMVEAPVRFNSLEFLVHLYTCLCRTVLADVRFNPAALRQAVLGPILLPRSVRPTALLGSLSGIVLALLAAALAHRATGGGWPVPPWGPHTWEALGAAAAAIAAMLAVGWRTRRAVIEVRQIVNLAADADSRLRRLNFQRTDTRSQAGALVGPLGSGLSIGTTQQFVEQTMTLPELIDDYRDFVERLVAALQQDWRPQNEKRRRERDVDASQADVRLVIGIDAIDQIENPREARKFLNDLSSVFGTSRCVYLISVSPDTLAAVDPRMVPLKTSSGGTFDEMVWVDPLSLSDACELLDRRVTGFPVGFIALAYVLSGGLPRELLRIGRAIFSTIGPPPDSAANAATLERHRADPPAITLAAAASRVIDDEIEALKHRTLASAASHDVSATPELLKLLSEDGWPATELTSPDERPRSLKALLDEVSGLWSDVPSEQQQLADKKGEADPYTAEVCDSFLASIYFLLTVRQLFISDPKLVVNPLACQREALEPEGLECRHEHAADWLNDSSVVLNNLARARIALGVSPYLAEALIRDARGCLCAAGHPGFVADIALQFLTPSR